MNTNGDHIWTKAIATKKDDESFSIISDKNGSIYVSGSTQGNLNNAKNKGEEDAFITKFNTDGDLLWTTLIGGTGSQWSTSLAIAEDGSIYGCGSIDGGLDMESHSETDVFAYKLNSSNNFRFNIFISGRLYELLDKLWFYFFILPIIFCII